MKKVLGENNLFTETQKDYMHFVNKHIFGFPRLEQYEQFIRLLIKVRDPKLSKEFTPKKVYEILNDSLQTLSDEDLRAMVDAARGKLEAEMEELKETKEKLEKSYKRAGELKAEKSLLEREKEAVGTIDLEEADEKLRQCRNRQEDARKEFAMYCQSIENHRNAIREYDAAARGIQKNIDAYQMEIEQLVHEMDELQELICFSGHGQILSLWKNSDGYDECKKIRSEIEKLSKNVEAALEELKKFKEIQIQWDRLSEECSSLEEKKAQAWRQVNDAETMEEALRDDLIEAYYGLEQHNQEFYLSKKELGQMAVYIQKYQGMPDYGSIRNHIGNIWEMKNQKLGSGLSALEVRKEKTGGVFESLQGRIEGIRKRSKFISTKYKTIYKVEKNNF